MTLIWYLIIYVRYGDSMNIKFKAAACSIAVATLSLIIYLNVRSSFIQKEYIRNIESISISLNSEIAKTSANASREDIGAEFKKIITGHDELLLIAQKDSDGNFVAGFAAPGWKKEIYDSITNDFLDGRFPVNATKIKYYGSDKAYIIVRQLPSAQIITAFPHKYTNKLLLQVSIEMLALLAAGISLTLLYFRKKSQFKPAEKSDSRKNSAPKKSRENIDGSVSKKLAALTSTYSLNSASIFIYNKEAKTLQKTYELKEGTFTKLAENIGETEKRAELIKELANGSPLIKNRSKNAVLPVLDGKNLLGALALSGSRALKGEELGSIKDDCRDLALIIAKRKKES